MYLFAIGTLILAASKHFLFSARKVGLESLGC